MFTQFIGKANQSSIHLLWKSTVLEFFPYDETEHKSEEGAGTQFEELNIDAAKEKKMNELKRKLVMHT